MTVMPIKEIDVNGVKVPLLEMGTGDIGIYQTRDNSPVLLFKNIPPQDLKKNPEDQVNEEGDLPGAEENEFVLGITFSSPISCIHFVRSILETQKKFFK